MYGVFVGMQWTNDREANQRIDNGNYSSAELISIKIPMNLPYAYETYGSDRVKGEFEHQGELYRLVEKKLTNDTLTIFCVKDKGHRRFTDAIASFVKSFTDQSAGGSPSKASSFIKDYIAQSEVAKMSFSVGRSAIHDTVVCNNLIATTYPTPTPPPKAIIQIA